MNTVFYNEQNLAINKLESDRQELENVYIGNSKFHQKNWSRYEEGKSKFNGILFLIGGFWLLFKGMLLYGCIYFAIIFSGGLLIPDKYEFLWKALSVGINVLLFFKGNQLYYQYVQKKIKDITELIEDQEQRIKALKKSKNQNVIIGIILSLVLTLLIIWGAIYGGNGTEIEIYSNQFDSFNLGDYESLVSESFSDITSADSDLSDAEILLIMQDVIIPNQELLIEKSALIVLENQELARIHNIYIEAQKIQLEAFVSMMNGLENGNQKHIEKGLLLLDEANIKMSEFENGINTFIGKK